MTAGLLAAQALAETPAPCPAVDKWQVFRDLRAARQVYGLASGTLAVLNALLSFHPPARLNGDGAIIVFPSNAALSERANGLSEATLRRHLSRLLEAGLILRHDSPNGKRYAVRRGDGPPALAFGFDLRPLLLRAGQIAEHAATCRAAEDDLRRAREAAVLRLRDAVKLVAYACECHSDTISETLLTQLADHKRALRRKLDVSGFRSVETELLSLIAHVRDHLETAVQTPYLTGSDSQNERHCQKSESENLDKGNEPEAIGTTPRELPLSLILTACPRTTGFLGKEPDSWQGLQDLTETIRPWLGISTDVWQRATCVLGDRGAATVLSCILQRTPHIRSPGAYLRCIVGKAEAGTFSPRGMVLALLQQAERPMVAS